MLNLLLTDVLTFSTYRCAETIHPEFTDGKMQMCFAFIHNTLDRDREAWNATRDSRVEAGRKGGQKTAAQRSINTANQSQQMTAIQAVTVPVPESVTDPVTNIEEAKKKRKKGSQFVAPSVKEIAAFCKERENGLDPQKIYDYYSLGNWKDQNGKSVKNWKMKIVAVWEKGSKHDNVAKDDSEIDLSWRGKKTSVNPSDMVEFPVGSGCYRPKWEVNPDE